MTSLLHAFQAERIKVRGTFLAKSPILFPFLVVIFPFIALAAGTSEKLNAAAPGGGASEFASGCFMGWLFAMLPLYALQIALMSYQGEHTQGLWKHLNALPTPGRTQVLAKQLMGAWQMLLGTLSLATQLLLVLGLLKLMRPGLGVRFAPPAFWWFLGRDILLCGAAGLVILAPLMVVAARFRNIGVAITTGVFGITASFFLKPTDTLAAFFPWSMGKVWLMHALYRKEPMQLWWMLPALACIGVSFGVHAWWRGRKPLY